MDGGDLHGGGSGDARPSTRPDDGLPGTGRVRALSDGLYEDPRPTHGGWRFFDGGTTAVLETTDGHTLVLTSKRTGNTNYDGQYWAAARSNHPGGVNVCMGDGSVRFIKSSISKTVWQGLGTRSGGEVISADAY